MCCAKSLTERAVQDGTLSSVVNGTLRHVWTPLPVESPVQDGTVQHGQDRSSNHMGALPWERNW